MHLYFLFTLLICTSAIFAYINYKFLKMSFVIGLFFLSFCVSLLLIKSNLLQTPHIVELKAFIKSFNISKFILEILLGFLLFAGSLHTKWDEIKKYLKQIALLSILGVLISTLFIAALFYGICELLHIGTPFIYCLLFGALISPTDPIAVIGILTKANVSKKIESIIVGESLFNDGIGVVVFISLLHTLNSGSTSLHLGEFGLLFLQEAIGGIAFGLALGFILHRLLKSIDQYETEVLLMLAFVMGGYSLSLYLHLSGPLAMVVMGLLIGNFKKEKSMSSVTKEYVNKFWELMDVILNAILFIIIALVIVVIDFQPIFFLLGLAGIVIVLLSRIFVVYLPKLLAPKLMGLTKQESKLMVWGGLRGGLSIALVLSLPESESKNMLTIVTYMCVLFSILIQGLTIGKLAKKGG
ncbi:MAG: sodium:proton antiporter [Sphingobacteriales bacterium]|nr:sodium:proton antiporter [Sphingobacteriales bacterium]